MDTYHPKPDDRDRSIRWARNILRGTFFVLDTETTGLLKSPNAEIVQMGILRHSPDCEPSVEMDMLLKPMVPIPADATNIHGITNEMVSTAPPFGKVYRRMTNLLSRNVVVIYNCDYDRGLIGRELTRAMGDPANVANFVGSCRWYCAMIMYAAFVGEVGLYGDYKWQKLPNTEDDAHSAISDCQATLRIIKEMAAARMMNEIEIGREVAHAA